MASRSSSRAERCGSQRKAGTGNCGGTQVGLQNAWERLRLLYGEAARLEVRNRDEQSVPAEVVLPAPRAAAEAQ